MPDYKEALDVALKFISYQPRSVYQVTRKLNSKHFKQTIVQQVVSKLKEAGYVDDRLFAKSIIDESVSKNYGQIRVKQNLMNKGIEREIIEELMLNYNFDGEYDRAEAVAIKKLEKLSNLENDKKYRRLMSYIVRLGYKAGTANRICNKLIKNEQAN